MDSRQEIMHETGMEVRRTGWDIALGALLLIGGLIILGHAAFATAVSVLFLGWVLLFTGLVGFVGAFFRIGKGGFWSAALGGALMAVLGIVFLRNPGLAALTLTLVAGTLFLATGVVRIVAAFSEPAYRWVLLTGGVIAAALGLIILFNLFTATFTLLGILLGVQVLVEGLMMMLVGRVRERRPVPA